MRSQAQKVEFSLKPVTDADLRSLGASLDALGVWTFRGWFSRSDSPAASPSLQRRQDDQEARFILV